MFTARPDRSSACSPRGMALWQNRGTAMSGAGSSQKPVLGRDIRHGYPSICKETGHNADSSGQNRRNSHKEG